MLPEAVLYGGHTTIRYLLPAYQGEYLVPVAGRAAQTHSLYGAQLVDSAGFAGGDLLEVRVVEHDVSGHPLLSCLLTPPASQPLKKHRVHCSKILVHLLQPAEPTQELLPFTNYSSLPSDPHLLLHLSNPNL